MHRSEPGLCQQPRGNAAANRVLAADEHKLVRGVEHGRRAGRQVQREQSRAGDMSEGRELVRCADVEHGGAGIDQRRRLLASDTPDLHIEAGIQLHGRYSTAGLAPATGDKETRGLQESRRP